MSTCANPHDASDPASLTPSMVAIMPGADRLAPQLLRDAALRFFQESCVWRDQRAYLQVTADTQDYTLPAYTPGTIARVIDVWRAGDDVSGGKRIRELRDVGVDDHTTTNGSVEQRWHAPDNANIYFQRPFSEPASLRLHVALKPKITDYLCNEHLLQEYRDAILAYAWYSAARSRHEALRDLKAAATYLADYNTLLREAVRHYQWVTTSDRPPMSRLGADMEHNDPSERYQ